SRAQVDPLRRSREPFDPLKYEPSAATDLEHVAPRTEPTDESCLELVQQLVVTAWVVLPPSGLVAERNRVVIRAIRFVAARCVHLALSIREVSPSWRNSAPTNRRLALPKTLGASKLEGKHCAPRPSIMKPGDHPDFFRLPPPPGRSRESRIVLDDLGR